jgi:hypothetical protein
VKSRYQKLAVDYKQVASGRQSDEYEPEYRFLFGFGGAGMPNVGGTKRDSSMLNVQVRATEKFNNRRTEFGMLLSVLKTTSSLLTEYPTEKADGAEAAEDDDEPAIPATEERLTKPVPAAFETALAVYGMFGHVFLGSVESYNHVRHGFQTGLGFLASAGYVAPALRAGWDVYLGRRFTVSAAGNYIAPSSILVEGQTVKTKGGPGADVVLSFNY